MQGARGEIIGLYAALSGACPCGRAGPGGVVGGKCGGV